MLQIRCWRAQHSASNAEHFLDFANTQSLKYISGFGFQRCSAKSPCFETCQAANSVPQLQMAEIGNMANVYRQKAKNKHNKKTISTKNTCANTHTHTHNQQTHKDACTHPKQPKKTRTKTFCGHMVTGRSLRQTLKSHVLELFFLQGWAGAKTGKHVHETQQDKRACVL